MVINDREQGCCRNYVSNHDRQHIFSYKVVPLDLSYICSSKDS